MTDQEMKEAVEHRDVLMAIRSIIATPQGKVFIRYLYKHLGVAELPELGLEGSFLMDKIGYLRAGNAIFKLISEASTIISGELLAEVEKEKYENVYRRNENSNTIVE